MKYSYLLAAMMCGGMMMSMASCSSDDPDNTPAIEKDYFTVENATYCEGALPVGEEALSGVAFNDRALAGGMNFISVVSNTEYQKFYVGVADVDGYYEYTPTQANETSSQTHTYMIPVVYSTSLSGDMKMEISGETSDGKITDKYSANIKYVESISGDLAINLTFSNAKDIDLHLICPNGHEIYYGSRGGEVYDNDGNILFTYGLDHDSNAACNIDGLNNENIVLPEQCVMNGEYTVKVNMYRNCNSSIATTWSIIARYKNNIIPVTTGANPASGVYPVGARNGDHTVVMTFKIDDANGHLPGYEPEEDEDDYAAAVSRALGMHKNVKFGDKVYGFKAPALSTGEINKIKDHFNNTID